MATINVIEMYSGDSRPNTNFALLKGLGVFGAIHRASQGSYYKDAAYADRRKAAQDAGILWGASHLLDSSDVQTQADFFLEVSGASAGDPIAMVCEFSNISAAPTLQQTMQFMSIVDRALPAVSTVLYSSGYIRETLRANDVAPAGYQNPDMVGAPAFFGKHRLWLGEQGPADTIPFPWDRAQSINRPAPGVWLWQYAPVGNYNQFVGKADGNFYNGTFEQLSNNWVS